jgi:hypothetical protein
MAGTIVADTLTHSTAGSLTTDYVVNGSAKAWCHWTETTTTAAQQSLNVTSLTDNGTGKTTVSFVSSFDYNDFAVTAGAQGFGDGFNDNNAPVMMLLRDEVDPRTTGDVDFMHCSRGKTNGANFDDATYASTIIMGDLA